MHIDRLERTWIIIFSVMLGIFFATVLAAGFIFGVRPPSSTGDSFINPNTLDQSIDFNPQSLGIVSVGEREFEVRVVAQMWAFNFGSPSPQAMIDAGAYIDRDSAGLPVLHVRQGDHVTFIITSRDITHGFLLQQHNVNFEVVPGHVARTRVTFNRVGEFGLVCHEYCGINHHNMHAKVIVTDAPLESIALGD